MEFRFVSLSGLLTETWIPRDLEYFLEHLRRREKVQTPNRFLMPRGFRSRNRAIGDRAGGFDLNIHQRR